MSAATAIRVPNPSPFNTLILYEDSSSTTGPQFLDTHLDEAGSEIHDNETYRHAPIPTSRDNLISGEMPLEAITTQSIMGDVVIETEPELHNVRRAIIDILEKGQEDILEVGIRPTFTIEIERLIEMHGGLAFDALHDVLASPTNSSEVLSEALRWIALDSNEETSQARSSLLVTALNHTSVHVRDCAALGLGYMEDAQSIPYLERAIARERSEELRADMTQVLQELKSLA